MQGDILSVTASYLGLATVGSGVLPPESNMVEISSLTQMFRDLIGAPSLALGHVMSVSDKDDAFEWHLSSGRTMRCPATSYVIELPFGLLALVVYCYVTETLSVDEIIEMAARLRGTEHQMGVEVMGDLFYVNRESRVGIRQFIWSFFSPTNASLILPIVYAKEFTPHLDTAALIQERFSQEVAAIVTLAIRRSKFIKSSFADQILATDGHPYTYGITIYSPTCTFEIHPRQVNEIAAQKGVSVDEHHSREWNSLCGILIIVLFQRASLESDSRELDLLLDSHKNISGINLLRNLVLLQRISRQRRQIAKRLGIYLNVNLSQRDYIKYVLQSARRSFLLDSLYNSVSTKLDHIRDDTNSLYGAYTTAIVISLTVISALTGMVSLLALQRGH